MMMSHSSSSNEDSLDILSSIIITILVITCCLGYGATVIVGQSYESNVVKGISCVPLLQTYVAIDYIATANTNVVANNIRAAVVGVVAIPFYCAFIFAIVIRVLRRVSVEEEVIEDDRSIEA